MCKKEAATDVLTLQVSVLFVSSVGLCQNGTTLINTHTARAVIVHTGTYTVAIFPTGTLGACWRFGTRPFFSSSRHTQHTCQYAAPTAPTAL